MRNRVGHKLVLTWIAAALLFLTGNAQAVSLEKIEVASSLGENLYAEIPLKLDVDESLTKVSVEIASASDYKIFEVFRDQVLNSLRVDVISDGRGTRVKLSSRTTLQSPFFNLVLKIRYGRVTHFKKFPVFLEPPKSIQTIAEKKPLPSVKVISPSDATQPPVVAVVPVAEDAEDGAAPVFKPYDGWARTGRYGPIVRGDTLSTVAERLRIDYRYTRNQIMAALFEKNRSKFKQDNMNLLQAGSHLDVPVAAEVERLSKSQALAVLADHEKRWKQLTKQPRYAAEKVAQQTRYSKRVRVGHRADGVASTPSAAQALKTPVKPETTLPITEKTTTTAAETEPKASVPVASELAKKMDILASENSALIASLKKKNAALQRQLEENEKLLNQKVDSVMEVEAASKAAISKLEILVAQLHGQLEEVRKEARSNQGGSPAWMIWLLSGLIAVLLGVVAFLVRREPVHPAVAANSQNIEARVAIPETRDEPAPEVDERGDAWKAALADAEKGSSDATPAAVPNANVDYLTEADMYIRYGMEDEALQRLDMALRLQPENVEAHIKKAEMLRSSNNSKGFEEAVAVAGNVLDTAALEHFRSTVVDSTVSNASIGGKSYDRSSDEITEGLTEQVENKAEAFAASDSGEMKAEDKIETDGLDFDISDALQTDSSDMNRQSETMEWDDAGEMDWLQETPLATDDLSVTEAAGQQSDASDQPEEGQPKAQTEEQADSSSDDEWASPDSIELAEDISENQKDDTPDETADAPDELAFEQAGQEADLEINLDSMDRDVTQELDNLLGELQQGAGEQESLDDLQTDDEASDNQMDGAIDLGMDEGGDVSQELDNLLGELQQDAGEQDAGEQDSQPDAELSGDQMGESIDLDDSEATQELDNLLGELQQEAGEQDSQPDAELSGNQMDESIDLDGDSEATQELDSLLSEFSDDDEDEKKE